MVKVVPNYRLSIGDPWVQGSTIMRTRLLVSKEGLGIIGQDLCVSKTMLHIDIFHFIFAKLRNIL